MNKADCAAAHSVGGGRFGNCVQIHSDLMADSSHGLVIETLTNYPQLMSNRYIRLLDLMQRPGGCRVDEACAALRVTPAGCRGMIRDLKRLMHVKTVYLEHGGRGKGRRAVHFAHTPQPTEWTQEPGSTIR
jgi:hypothetical protein